MKNALFISMFLTACGSTLGGTNSPDTDSAVVDSQPADASTCPAPTPPDPSQPIAYGDIIHGDWAPDPGYVLYSYFIARDSKRYVIPDGGATFSGDHITHSWNLSPVVTRIVPIRVIAAIQIGGNVTIRPGTYFIRPSAYPQVYAITPGGVLHMMSESLGAALFGSDWRNRVIIMPDTFFVNYAIGEAVNPSRHPEGTLVYFARDPAQLYYVTSEGRARPITPAGYCANRFDRQWAVVTDIGYTYGTPITEREAPLADPYYPR